MSATIIYDYRKGFIYDCDAEEEYQEDESLRKEMACGTKQSVWKTDFDRAFIVREKVDKDGTKIITIRMNDGDGSRKLESDEFYVIMNYKDQKEAPDCYQEILEKWAEEKWWDERTGRNARK
jgi:hypothetical protein